MADEREGGEDLLAALARWAADQRAATAASDRALERSLRVQAEGSATFAGVLVDLAERAATLTVSFAGQTRSGRLVAAGPDFCVIESQVSGPVLVAVAAIESVTQGASAGSGDRPSALEIGFASALTWLAEERSPVIITTASGARVSGDLIAVGTDVITVRSDTQLQRNSHLPLAAVAACEIR